ncbi:MAG: biotin/lipoyl-containing protein, partial [Bryobacteraceae bacterium]
MKLLVVVDGADAQELLLERDGGVCRYTFHGAERTATVMEVEPGVYSVLIGGRSYAVRVNGAEVETNGCTFVVEVRDPRRSRRRSRAGLGEGRQNISAPMPGKVVRVLAAAGDAVEAGQGVVVVEAMKMQNEIKAPKAGTVVEVRAQEGAT